MKKILLIAIILFLSFYSEAQFIDNKLDISVGYIHSSFFEDNLISENGFITPSIYSNMNDNLGFSIKASYKIKPNLSIGIGISDITLTNWSNSEYDNYNESTLVNYLIQPSIQLHNKFVESGIFNRIRIFVEACPIVGITKLELANPIFDIQSSTGEQTGPMSSSDFIYGIKGGIGIEYSINQEFGIFCNYGISQNWVNSKLYNDNSVLSSTLELGLVLKFYKNKRFYY